jgi:DNA-binding response OmpR family regulator
MIRRCLKNHVLIQVSNMHDFERTLDSLRFDLVITDMEFPGGSGLQVAERARRIATPCVMFSSYLDVRAEAEALGAQFVEKPDASELVKLVDALAARDR